MEDQDKPSCPVCGAVDPKENFIDNGILGPGYSARVVDYTCRKCGVKFERPDKT